ncbi:glycosyltransferase [Prochlorococcus marinus]|uniref:glycosyltransferase n=1 Tax=Prochlorococcus marinus TaxID=1219 RepID=UPI0022B3A62E|nr:glycosyltransferase [Prochlorococcus marinus]
MPLRILGLALYGPKAASHRVRLSQYKDFLLENGIILDIHSLLDNEYLERRFNNQTPKLFKLIKLLITRIIILLRSTSQYDIYIIQGELLPLVPFYIERLFLKLPYIYDYDDAFYLKYNYFPLNIILKNKFKNVIKNALSVAAGNNLLYKYAFKNNQYVFRLPSVVDTNIYKSLPILKNKNDVFTLGWLGSPTTADYLKILIEPLKFISQRIPIRLVVIGGEPPSIPGIQIVQRKWNLNTHVEEIQKFDVGLMPLPDNAWTRGKCAYKLIQYMSCGIPVIASSVGANLDVVPSNCGFLVSNKHEWIEAIQLLSSDKNLRESMGKASSKWVLNEYSLQKNKSELLKMLIDTKSRIKH